MPLPPTARLYLDDHCLRAQARVLAIESDTFACDRTCFYPGGGGQPCDTGKIHFAAGETREVSLVRSDEAGVVWHVATAPLPSGLVGEQVQLAVDLERRTAVTRYHTVLHVLNTTALRDYGGWITGVKIDEDYSRIDFKIEGFTAALCAELERKVNAVLEKDHRLRAYYLAENEFRQREDLLRTLDARPPVIDGKVRVVEIEGFDAQACGGTHVSSTAEIGRFSIFRTENKGRINKRLYIKLSPNQSQSL
jgi:misacylated tRNA(Ala) deacylase